MSIKHAVLGLIAESPCHGYAVRARFEERLGDLFDLGSGRVYGVLSRLEREGLVAGEAERMGRRRRRIYSIRPAGRRELLAWAHSEPSPMASLADLALRLLAVRSDPEAVAGVVRAWQRHERRTLDILERHPVGVALPEILALVRPHAQGQDNGQVP